VHVAVNRQTRGGEKLGPEFVIDPEAALRSMTLDAAALGFEEKIKGSLSIGKLGDLVVLSDDPLAINPANIDEIEVEQTVINGKIVYDRAVEGGSRKDERNSRNPDLETSFISH
jgi:predicted amidohydrolase YtcJ